MKSKLIYLTVFIGLLSTALYPQMLSGTVDYSFFYDDNPLRQNDGSEEYINSVQTRLDFKPFNREFYIFYSGGYDAFKNINDRNYQNHYFGFNYAFSSSDSSEENIFTGINYALKKGTSDYAVYDFTQLTAFANGNFYLSDDQLISAGYRTAYKNFPDLYNLIHVENLVSLGYSRFFESGTGLFLQAVAGNKNYSSDQLLQSVTGMGMRGKGRFMNSSKSVNVAQLRSSVKISQSVFEKTGLSVYYLNRTNLTKTKQNFLSTELIYSDDSELWDDPYGFQGNEAGLELTQILPYNLTAKFSVDYSNRHYLNNAADSLGLTQRIDNKTEIWGGLSKSFNSLSFIESLELGIEYMYIINRSNTEFFDYRNNLFQLSLQLGF